MTFREILELNKINIIETTSIQEVFRRHQPLMKINDNGDVIDQIVGSLNSPIVRRGKDNIYHENMMGFKDKISRFVKSGDPIRFVFQGFPFKCHNPFETMRVTPDLGDVAFLNRLGDINETIKQVYSPGVEFVILAEGKTYKDLFGATDEEVDHFARICTGFAGRVGLDKVVSFVDFVDLLEDEQGFIEACRKQEDLITRNSSTGEIVDQLTHVMMRSLPATSEIALEDLYAVLNPRTGINELNDRQLKLFDQMMTNGRKLAIRYVAIQQIKHGLGIIDNKFPDHVYVSTTAKRERYSFHPIHRRTRLYPHHGVPILGSDKVDIEFLGEVLSNHTIYTAVFCSDDVEDAPFYFLKGRQYIKR